MNFRRKGKSIFDENLQSLSTECSLYERVLDDNTLNRVLIAEIFRTNMGTHIHQLTHILMTAAGSLRGSNTL